MDGKKFPLPLRTETILGKERSLLLIEPFVFESSILGTIKIANGFDTDLASIPRMFWRVFPPAGKYTAAAIVHDWLYWYQSPDAHETAAIHIPREKADAVFLEAMDALGVNWLTRHTIHRSVRLGGGFAWRGNYTKRTGKPYPKQPDPMPDFYRQRHIKR